MIYILPAFIFLVALYSSSAQSIIEVSGIITTNTIWLADTVKVTGDATVNYNVTLTINPGTYLEFQGYFRMKIFGTILAEGTEDQLIVFTIDDTTGISYPDNTSGGWHGILFDNGYSGSNGAMFDNDTSRLSFCRFEYCKTSTSVGN